MPKLDGSQQEYYISISSYAVKGIYDYCKSKKSCSVCRFSEKSKDGYNCIFVSDIQGNYSPRGVVDLYNVWMKSADAYKIMLYCKKKNYKCSSCRFSIFNIVKKTKENRFSACIFANCPCGWDSFGY